MSIETLSILSAFHTDEVQSISRRDISLFHPQQIRSSVNVWVNVFYSFQSFLNKNRNILTETHNIHTQ